MQIIEKKLAELTPYDRNPRRNDGAVDAVAASISEFGFKVPVVIDADGVIVAGHTRVKAAKKLGLKTVPCVVADDLTPDQIKAFRLADNKTGELAEWDFDLLDLELGDIELDMSAFGFDMDGEEEYPDESELDAETEQDEKTVARLVFPDYKSYARYESKIKEFAGSIGASVTVGK